LVIFIKFFEANQNIFHTRVTLIAPTKHNIFINRFNFQQIETKKTLDNQLDISGQIKKQKQSLNQIFIKIFFISFSLSF